MMKILVTGGAGYKGTVLTRKLLEQGYKVTLLDNFMYGYEPIMHLATNKNLEIIKHDIRNGIPDIRLYDVIFHLAGISGFPACASNPHSAQLDRCRGHQAYSERPVGRTDAHQCIHHVLIREVRTAVR